MQALPQINLILFKNFSTSSPFYLNKRWERTQESHKPQRHCRLQIPWVTLIFSVLSKSPVWSSSETQETQGQLVGARESRNGRKKIFDAEKERTKRGAPLFVLYFSSPNIFSPVTTFPRPTSCPWVSEDPEW